MGGNLKYLGMYIEKTDVSTDKNIEIKDILNDFYLVNYKPPIKFARKT